MNRVLKLTVAATVILFVSLTATAKTFEQGMAYYHAKQYEEAYQVFEEMALYGNAKAQFNIGVMHARGEFKQKDMIAAWAWMKLAVDSGGDAGQEKILEKVAKKLSVSEMSQAHVLFEELVAVYGKDGNFAKTLPVFGVSTQTSFSEARRLKMMAPKYPKDMATLGRGGVVDTQFAIEKDGTIRNITVFATANKSFISASLEALRKSRYEPATADGSAVVQLGMKNRYIFEMYGSEVDDKALKEFVEPLKQQAEIGGSEEKYAYAYTLSMLETMLGGRDDQPAEKLDRSTDWLVESVRYGSPLAKYEMGRRMSYGSQCKEDPANGYLWVERAAADNILDAKYMLGMAKLQGIHYSQNIAEGMAVIKDAADNGFNHAQVRYAWLLATASSTNKADAAIAQTYLDNLEEDYADELSRLEAQLAVYLAAGNKKKAAKELKRFQKYTKKYDIPVARLTAMDASFNAGTAYSEAI
ncbi:energy transducer TonB [Teredinibacter waterburyi]|uniref:energy transducer TonB n=1 Tax=Teredinibacter waterburyi TaxID=1500538 RepID=UPI00165FA6C5|nr:energy transducer TonB [Teredinibacter waterburyi]